MRLARPGARLLAVALALTLAGAAAAEVVLRQGASVLSVGATEPPVAFAAGAQSAEGRHVKSFALTVNKTGFVASLRGVPQAIVAVPELARLENGGASAQTVTVSAERTSSAAVLAYRLEFLDGTSLVGTLDLRASSPSTTFTLAGGAALKVRAVLQLAEGAGNHDAVDLRDVRVQVMG